MKRTSCLALLLFGVLFSDPVLSAPVLITAENAAEFQQTAAKLAFACRVSASAAEFGRLSSAAVEAGVTTWTALPLRTQKRLRSLRQRRTTAVKGRIRSARSSGASGARLRRLRVKLTAVRSAMRNFDSAIEACRELSPAPTPTATSSPDEITLRLVKVAEGFTNPVHATHAGDGSGRLFVVEQAGRIKILSNGHTAAEPFLDIRSAVRAGGERGLLSAAFHPDYAQNGRFFINYTRGDGATVVSELRIAAGNPARADAGSERVLLAVAQPFSNHNGGLAAFGPDGFLYIGMGDGGSGGDPEGHGQNLGTLLGALLRIDVNSGNPYGIPADNPFRGRQGARPEIYAYGLRNPWRFSFDRQSGELYLADVGQGAWEEIDLITAGRNYGWNRREGAHCFPPGTKCAAAGLTDPIHEYGRGAGQSITGGFVYRGSAFPKLVGKYVFADYVSGRVWVYRKDQGRVVANLAFRGNPASFGEDEAGELYLVDYHGRLFRVEAD